MDGRRFRISPQDLYRLIGSAGAPVMLDLRAASGFEADPAIIVGAVRRAPEGVEQWRRELPRDRLVVIYSRDEPAAAAAALDASGLAPRILDGGLQEWQRLGLPTRQVRSGDTGSWVTRERPKVDRIACPWLIRRFIDPAARFLYVPPAAVASVAEREGATPYDVVGCEFGHAGEYCSFDAFIRLYAIADAPLDRLAVIVRGADTNRPELAPEAPLLLALSQELSQRFADDHAMLERGMILYDALYAWCRSEVLHAG